MLSRPIPAATYNLVTAGEAEIERGTEQYPATVDEVSNPSPDPEIRALSPNSCNRASLRPCSGQRADEHDVDRKLAPCQPYAS
ncbi:hypothetical protein RW1_035_00910 [Rhodococcus wratislaviensis NBRC 100605]|uniref:Uncharacterized protein n=1 Tax=Rhodococcus wratislaviensis NBRC 100605 TaxID=1219028 RepID=X0Q806_RHOWR|nr:hypothetical protein RW1_035_00910 [Rhodococcus wratislaviensis NBRC 100605]